MNKTYLRVFSCALALSFSASFLAGCTSKSISCESGDCDCAPPDEVYIEEPGIGQLRETIISVLDGIRNYRPGTLGSSLKIQIVAFSFIDFSQEDAASDIATFTNIASGYIAGLDDESLGFFKETVTRIEEIASQLFAEGLESLLPILNDAGNPQKHEEYDQEKYNALMTALKNILEQYR